MKRRERFSAAYVHELEDRATRAERALREERAKRLAAQEEVDELREQVDAPVYRAVTDFGVPIHEGTSEASAIAAARRHFHRTAVHVGVVGGGSSWTTREQGAMQDAHGRYVGPDPQRVAGVEREARLYRIAAKLEALRQG